MGRKARGPTIGKQRCWWSAVANWQQQEPTTRKCRSRIPISQDPTAAIRVRPQYSVFLCTAVIIITPAGVFLSPLALVRSRSGPPPPSFEDPRPPSVRLSVVPTSSKARNLGLTIRQERSSTIPIRDVQDRLSKFQSHLIDISYYVYQSIITYYYELHIITHTLLYNTYIHYYMEIYFHMCIFLYVYILYEIS